MKIFKRVAIIFAIFIIVLALGCFLGIFFYVKKTCDRAEDRYGEGCQNALIAVMEDDKSSAREKNNAIWAMGQMADQEFLETLEKFYAGSVPEGREPLDEVVSQYEIKKAIRWINEGNITSWMYGWIKK